MSNNRFEFLEVGDAPFSSAPFSSAPPADPEPVPALLKGRTPGSLPPSAPDGWRISASIGGPGRHSGQFASPSGVAVDASGRLYVADSYNHRIQRILPCGGATPMGRRGHGRGEFLNPAAIAVDADERLYVVEHGNCRVQVFSSGGEYLAAFGRKGWGATELDGPTAIALAPCGSLFIADAGNRRVSKWTPDGQPVGIIAVTDSGAYFDRPHGVTVDRAGRVFVTDRRRSAVLVFNAALRFEGMIGGFGWAPGQFRDPAGIAVDEEGRLYLADAGNHRLQVLSPAGRCLHCVPEAVPDEPGGPFDGPLAVALASGGSVYVADTGNHRLVRLDPMRGER